MFFNVSGHLIYMKQSEQDGWDVDEGTWACELTLWVPWVHVGSLRAADHCNILALDVQTFHKVATEFHGPVFHPAIYARHVVQYMNYALSRGSLMGDDEHTIDDITFGSFPTYRVLMEVFPDCFEGGGTASPKHGRRNSNLFTNPEASMESSTFGSRASSDTSMSHVSSLGMMASIFGVGRHYRASERSSVRRRRITISSASAVASNRQSLANLGLKRASLASKKSNSDQAVSLKGKRKSALSVFSTR
eukprot:gnl/TRDRNA2_/TRDRNA2_177268_c13_seq1.p1 gnl/TRDRNA2_/TRDRNA2_177268_c13~~gnl/TRDRNA2_/TRDRNA2_177268_c13_seq1.p1  ORF type:complete len:248 (-),score=23.74 gnl/TRDRNA2_/TRDRNA2_177268_c13_seq1:178-921(-)